MPAVAQAAQVQRPQPREKITGFNPEEISKKTSHLAYQVADETGYLDGWYRMLFFESNRIGSAVHNKFIRGVEVENDKTLGDLLYVGRSNWDRFIVSPYRHLPVIPVQGNKVTVSPYVAFVKGLIYYDDATHKFARHQKARVCHAGLPGIMRLDVDFDIETGDVSQYLQLKDAITRRNYRVALTHPVVAMRAPVDVIRTIYSRPEFTHPSVTTAIYAPWDIEPAYSISQPRLDPTRPVMVGMVPNQAPVNI